MATSRAAKQAGKRGLVTVITGPARCGKTSRLLERYRQALAQYPPRSVLWLAPTYRSVSDVLSRLLSRELRACFSPGVMTFEGFAQQVLEATDQKVRPLSRLMKRELLRFLIDEVHAEGKLKYFAPIVGTVGLVDLVSQFISELKRLEIWPEHFRDACRQRGQSAKDIELLEIYQRYQNRLTEHSLYDAEGRFWNARQILREGKSRKVNDQVDRLKLVVVDGFTDFTRTQHEILQILAGRVEEMLISLPLEEEPRRADLFAKSLDTLAKLREGLDAIEEPMPRRRSPWPLMDHLESQLFQNPRVTRDAPSSVGVEILAASREYGEVELIGHRIKELLLHGCDASQNQPVRPGEIAVVYRSLRGADALIREVFTDLGIPFSLETSPTLDTVPVCRAFMSLLSLAAEDWPFRSVLAVLGNNYICPDWPQWADGQGAEAAERLVRELQVPSGAEALLEAARAKVQQAAAEAGLAVDDLDAIDADSLPEPAEDDHVAQGTLAAFRWYHMGYAYLKRLHEALERLPRQGTQNQWRVALENLANELGLPRAIANDEDPQRAARDLAAWTRLLAALGSGDGLFESLGERPPVVQLGGLVDLLAEVLRAEQLPRWHDDVGRVRVLNAVSVRTLEVPYLFFAGLSEKAFPSPERADRLYSEAEYHRLRDAGLPVPTRDQRGQDEMLLFYEVLTRATRRLWLSYPAMNEKAEPLLPSPFLQEVIRAAGHTQLKRTEVADLSPVPRGHEPASPRELRIRGMHEALRGEVGLLAGVAVICSPDVLSNVFDALSAMRMRSRRAEFSVFEGVLQHPEVRDCLGERFHPERPWSASHLEQYASCPYQFFLERVLRIEPLDELALETDFASRGSLLHEVMNRLHDALNQRYGHPVSPGELDADTVAEVCEEVIADLEARSRGHDVASALRTIDLRQIRQWVREYYEQHVTYDKSWSALDQPMRPKHFEVSFGQAVRDGADELSTPEPLVLRYGDHELRLSGRIDRIDVGQAGNQQVFSIIDYKSGSKPRKADVPKEDRLPDGTNLQLELYALAAEEVLFRGQAAALDVGYWHCRDGGFFKWITANKVAGPGQPPRCEPLWATWRQQIVARVFQLVEGIKSGQFPVYSLDENCTGRCAFHTVCRVNQVRALEKQWPPTQAP